MVIFFFLVLDRSRNAENAYMLSMIDENDLADFIEENQMEPERMNDKQKCLTT